MNFLLIQERGRHEANRHFREALSMQRALEKLGHQAKVWGLGYHEYASYPFEQLAGGADVIFLLEQYESPAWVPDFSWFPGPRVFWTVDSHVNLAEHQAQVKRQKITHLLSSTARYLEAYETPHKYWFPNCYDDTLVGPRPEVAKDYPIGFCGNDNGRLEWLWMLEQGLGLRNGDIRRDIFVIGEAMVRALNSYCIGFNRNIADDINYRTFETTGCGTLLLTNYTPRLEDLFDIGKEIEVYNSPESLVNMATHLLNNPEHMKRIAAAGHARAKRDHTYTARAQRLLEILCTTG